MSANDLPIDALCPYLERHIDNFAGPARAHKFKGGQSNPTFHIQAASGEYVLRRQPAGKLLPSAHAVDREYFVLNLLQDTPVPVPRVYHLCTDPAIVGSMFYVMELCQGHVYWDTALPEQLSQQRSAIYAQSAETLAKIHNVDIHATGLNNYGKSENYYQRQLKRWSEQYHASCETEDPQMRALIEALRKHMPTDDVPASLVHGDYRMDNLIYDSTDHNIIAVIDWELSTLGHPISDLAYQCMQLRLPPSEQDYMLSGLGGLDVVPEGIPTEHEYVNHYIKARDGQLMVDKWYFYLAFAFFKLAAIAQGVVHRAQKGNASSTEAHQLAPMVKLLADMARDIIADKVSL